MQQLIQRYRARQREKRLKARWAEYFRSGGVIR